LKGLIPYQHYKRKVDEQAERKVGRHARRLRWRPERRSGKNERRGTRLRGRLKC